MKKIKEIFKRKQSNASNSLDGSSRYSTHPYGQAPVPIPSIHAVPIRYLPDGTPVFVEASPVHPDPRRFVVPSMHVESSPLAPPRPQAQAPAVVQSTTPPGSPPRPKQRTLPSSPTPAPSKSTLRVPAPDSSDAQKLKAEVEAVHMANWKKAQKMMWIAMDKVVDYNEFRNYWEEKRRMSEEEMDRQYQLLFGNWDKLKNIMLEYVKLDSDLSFLPILVERYGSIHNMELFRTIHKELLFQCPLLSRADLIGLDKGLAALPRRFARELLTFLPTIFEARYRAICANPPPPPADHSHVIRLTALLREHTAARNSDPAVTTTIVTQLEEELAKLPVEERKRYRLPRESLIDPNAATLTDAERKANYKKWRATTGYGLLDQWGDIEEKMEVEKERETELDKWMAEMALEPPEEDEEEAMKRETAEKAFARLNGWI